MHAWIWEGGAYLVCVSTYIKYLCKSDVCFAGTRGSPGPPKLCRNKINLFSWLHCPGSPGLYIFAKPSEVLFRLQMTLIPIRNSGSSFFGLPLSNLYQAEQSLLEILGEGRGAVQTTLNVYIKYLGSQLSVESLSFCPGVSVWLHVGPSHLKAPPIPFCPRPRHNPISIPPPYACSPSLSWESKRPIRFLSEAASQLILALFIYNLFFSVFTFWLC